MSVIRINAPRAVVDRRALVQAVAGIVDAHGGPIRDKDRNTGKGAANGRREIVELLRATLDAGRAEIARRLVDKPSAGHEVAEAQAYPGRSAASGDPRSRHHQRLSSGEPLARASG